MSFLFRRKKKDNEKKGSDVKISNETKRLYFTSEFNCMGDLTKDGHLSYEEFLRLMMLLGNPGDKEVVKKIWKSQGKDSGGYMSLEEYITMMFDKKIDSKTNTWRKLFAEFDTDGSGFATKAEVIKGLENIGIDVNSGMRKRVEEMDGNNDGKISYAEFLKKQLSLP